MRGGEHKPCIGCGLRKTNHTSGRCTRCRGKARNNQPRSLTFTSLRAANLERCITAWHPLMDRTPAEYAGELLGMATLLRRACDSADERGAVECIVDVVLMADLLAVRMGHSLTVAIPERFDAVSRRIGSKVFLGAGATGATGATT